MTEMNARVKGWDHLVDAIVEVGVALFLGADLTQKLCPSNTDD
jgi:hypothetical protein